LSTARGAATSFTDKKFYFSFKTQGLSVSPDLCFQVACNNAAVERLSRTDRASAVAAAVAHDINDEMTIILNSAWVSMQLLEPGHPARLLLHDLSAATQRCIWKTSTVLNYGARCGVHPVSAPLEHLAEGD
jgi:hypothetical protein